MIIIYFPKTLGGVSFEKAGKLYEGRKPIFFDKTGFLPSNSPLSQKNDQRGSPFGIPEVKLFVIDCFSLFLSIFTNSKFPLNSAFRILNLKSFHHKPIPQLRFFQLELGSFLFVLLGFCLFPYKKSCGKCG